MNYRICLFVSLLALLLAACGSERPALRAALSAVDVLSADDVAGFTQAREPRSFQFPADHGPHPDFRTEWWYYTGNLSNGQGRHFGYQLTFFRRGIAPGLSQQRPSDWATNQIYMAHLAVSDIANQQFYAFERFSRGAAGLAGSQGDPFRVFVEDWSAKGNGPQSMTMQLFAAQDGLVLDLQLESRKPPMLQGENGLSRKSPDGRSTSYYYSLTRMQTSGTLSIGEQQHQLAGYSWMDREWMTTALDAETVGWDWFGLHLDDGSDLLFAQVRLRDGSNYYFASLVDAAGNGRMLEVSPDSLTPLATWRSPHSGIEYPAGWRISLPNESIELTVEPLMAEQEHTGAIAYWEGAVQISGEHAGHPVGGFGYVELTGYNDPQQGRF
jgi:predicted secreted hydrolase